MMGGCGTFIVISLVIAGLLLSSVNYFLELQELNARANNGDSPSFQFTMDQRSGFFTSSTSDESELFTFLTMGDETNTIQMSSAPDSSLIYMAEAAGTWDEDPSASYNRIADGKETAADPIRYLMLAAVTADGLGDTDAALIYATIALYEAQKDPEKKALYAMLRPIAGQYLYDTPAKERLDDKDILKEIASTMYEDADIQRIQASTFGRFLKARVFLLAGNTRLAQIELNNRIDTTDFDVEIDFLRGEILAAQDKIEAAIPLWNAVALNDSAPDWVKTLAQNHLTENGSL